MSSGFARNWAVDDGEPGGTSPCSEDASVFPSFLFTTLNQSEGRHVSGYEIHLSNADGDCSVLLFSSNAEESKLATAYRLGDDDTALTW